MWFLTIATIYLVHGTTFALPGGGNKLTSTNFPNTYSNNEDTVQTLSVPGGYNMLITFQEFELETHDSCAYDYVQICDGNNLCGNKYCGSSLPDPITVSTSTATVKFHSDGSVSRKGFSLTYKKIRPEVAAFSIGGGPSALEGNICFGGKPICDDYWDNAGAGVFCRMMGYQNGNATYGSKYGQVSSDFSMDDVRCNGHETNLIDCNHTTQHNCRSLEGAGVICSGGSAFSISGGSSALEGNIFYDGKPICDDHWDNTDAGVFCKMMGYQNGSATHTSTYGQVSSNFSMDDVQCNGHETNLLDCNHTTQHNCGSTEGAGVICSVGGRWTAWSPWSSCSATCSNNISPTQFRTRSCTQSPAPYGGNECEGEPQEIKDCNKHKCYYEETGQIYLDGGYWGNWGSKETCTFPYFVTAMNLKVESLQGGADDTALNAVLLTCSNGEEISSRQSRWGYWRGKTSCSGGHYIKTAKIRRESNQQLYGDGDATTANGIRFWCTDGGIHHPSDGYWGQYHSARSCPAGSAVMGIKTQVDPHIAGDDNTAINDVILYCAKLLN